MVIPVWTVPMEYGSTQLVATGHLTWVPAPNPIPWYAMTVMTFVIGAATALNRRANITICLGLLALVATDILHTAGLINEFVGSNSSIANRIGPTTLPSVAAWVLTLYAIRQIMIRRTEGMWFGLLGAVIIALLGGITDLGALMQSQLAFAWNANLGRALVAISTGLGSGLSVAFIVLIRRQQRAESTSAFHDGIINEIAT